MGALEELTDKQRMFVIEYAADGDRLRAAREAGYIGPNSTLSVRATTLLANSKVKAALEEIGTRFDKALLSVDLLVHQLYRFITFDPAELEDEDGYLKVSLRSLPKEVRQCIASFEVETRTIPVKDDDPIVERKVKVKWVDKLKAVEYGMKWRKMLSGDTFNDNRTQNFNWSQFYDMPTDVVGKRMTEAISDAKTLPQQAEEDSQP